MSVLENGTKILVANGGNAYFWVCIVFCEPQTWWSFCLAVKTEVKAEKPPPPPPAPTPEPTPEVKTPVAKEEKVVMPEIDISRHEPHLGPRPRSHNRVLNPPGGKSSVTFY